MFRRVSAGALAKGALSLLGAGTLALGCAETPNALTGPTITAISAQQIVLGETVEFFGHDFLYDGEGTTRVRFEGQFVAADGSVIAVHKDFAVAFNGEEVEGDLRQVIALPRFGPFTNPFTGDARIGTFTGKVRPVTEDNDALVTEGKALETRIDIGPSIAIEAFQPLDAECGAPVLRVLPGIAYRLKARATGIKAVRYVYDISNVNGAQGVTRFDQTYNQPPPSDEIGIDASTGALIFNPVPDDVRFTVAVISITAYDAAGNSAETVLPITVHRPIEVAYDGKVELAERYPPVPVSGCIPGSIDSRVEYRETETETRRQSVQMTVSTSFLRSQGRTLSQDTRDGIAAGESRTRSESTRQSESENVAETTGVSYNESEANSVDYSTADGENWGWNLSQGESNEEYAERRLSAFGEGSVSGTVGVEGGASIPFVAEASAGVEVGAGVKAGVRGSNTGRDTARTTSNVGYSASGTRNEDRSYGSTTTEGRSESITGTYALTRARESAATDAETVDNTRTWSLGQGLSESDVVAQGDSERVAQTFVDSQSISTSQGLSATIPRSKIGIFYRQTTRNVKRVEVRSYDLCGLSSHVGEMQFNEWTWAPDLAIGDSCDTVPPPPGLPSARC
ncbi:MAG: hypothetical protein ACI9U2_002274, partial [Bradymonadia bacterium]